MDHGPWGPGVHSWACSGGMEEEEWWSRSGERGIGKEGTWDEVALGKHVSGRRADGLRFENMPASGGRIEGRSLCQEEPLREGAAVEAAMEGGQAMDAIGVGMCNGCHQTKHGNNRG